MVYSSTRPKTISTPPDLAVLYTLIWTFNCILVLTSGQSPKQKVQCTNSNSNISTACIYFLHVFLHFCATLACGDLAFFVTARKTCFEKLELCGFVGAEHRVLLGGSHGKYREGKSNVLLYRGIKGE